MNAPIFPIFSLKTYYNYVIVGGGGGNKDFGKKNGIVILNEDTTKDLAYYETEDIILGIFISKGTISLEEDNFNPKDITNSIADFPLYFGCKGTNNFYLCKFDLKSITLILKIKKVVDFAIFKHHLLFISNKKMYTLFDAIKNTKILSKKTNVNNSSKSLLSDESQEEYVYAIKKSGKKILIAREEGKTDVPDTWENFFIVGKRIHKICNENNNWCFVFNGKKYSYKTEIGDIACLEDETLVFYLKGTNSILNFIGKEEKSFPIEKITCINVDHNEFVTVGTGTGKGYLFKNSKLFCVKKLCDLPITAISYEKGYFFYSSFNGLVNRKKAFSLTKMVIFISVLLILLLAILINLFNLKKEIVN